MAMAALPVSKEVRLRKLQMVYSVPNLIPVGMSATDRVSEGDLQ